ncbi:hypothetical protein BJF78_35180 [Pseudonocardia sp. CNS-139]|nr:hypothetical protein BJF78_35180 [Pseudonocardia sp. CNS-139]
MSHRSSSATSAGGVAASDRPAAGSSGSASATSRARSSIGPPSATTTRTSRRTRASSCSRSAATSPAPGAAGARSRWIHDSTSVSGGGAAGSPDVSTSASFPVSVRRTTTIGWITRSTLAPARRTPAIRDSTRNGMSSVTISTTCPPGPPGPPGTSGSRTRISGSPCARIPASSRWPRAAASRTGWFSARCRSGAWRA